MKFLLGLPLLTALIFSTFLPVIAQDDDLDKLSFEETPLSEEKSPYFAVGGGFIGTWHFTNFDELKKNIRLKDYGVADIKAPVFIYGGHGFTAIPFIPNFRIGVFGAAGGTQIVTSILDTTRTLDYSLSMTGLSMDYAFQPLKKLVILPGINLGRSTITIETAQTIGSRDYLTELGKPDNPNNSYNKLTGGFWFVQPNLNIEYAVTAFSLVRINAGYMLGFSPSWKADRSESDVANMPKDINVSGMTLQFGIFLGLFN